MEGEALKYIGAGLTAFGALGGALGVGNVYAALLNGIARNPSAEPKLKSNAIVGMALAEGLGIVSLGLGLTMLFL